MKGVLTFSREPLLRMEFSMVMQWICFILYTKGIVPRRSINKLYAGNKRRGGFFVYSTVLMINNTTRALEKVERVKNFFLSQNEYTISILECLTQKTWHVSKVLQYVGYSFFFSSVAVRDNKSVSHRERTRLFSWEPPAKRGMMRARRFGLKRNRKTLPCCIRTATRWCITLLAVQQSDSSPSCKWISRW